MINRRQLLKSSAFAGAGLASGAAFAQSPNEKVVVAVMGVNSRGDQLASALGGVPAYEIAYICDVDERAIAKTTQTVMRRQQKTPQGVKDFRRILDDKAVDAIFIAAPDHWHAPATILACSAGKHVYCEKPACHNPREGELMIQAARKYNRVVQIGTQRRSQPAVVEAIAKVHAGEIGRVLLARGWYNNTRQTIGYGKPASVPDWLDFSLWQGPAPERPYRDNLVHYNWHWFWHWGTGELGNNGIHALDVCRWGLNVDYPTHVTSGGGKYRYQDDQETPDTHTVTFDFGDKASITWEGRSWHPRGFEESGFGVAFYGDKGSMIIDGANYRVYDMKDKVVTQSTGRLTDAPHLQNFAECVKSGKRSNADVEDGVKSTLLCHLGNIAWRTGRALDLDPKNGHIKDDKEARALWGRDYRKGWEPQV